MNKNNNSVGIEIISRFLGGLFITSFGALLVFKGANNITRIVGLPFLIYGIISFLSIIYIVIKRISTKNDEDSDAAQKVAIIAYSTIKIYHVITILILAGIIIAFDIYAIKNWNSNGQQILVFTIFCWLALIYYIFKKIKEK